ncbi:MAG: hypothetical protein ACI9MC_004056, partial [Kiritimatiellia bacterium]
MRVDVPVFVEFELPDGRALELDKKQGFAIRTGEYPPLY